MAGAAELYAHAKAHQAEQIKLGATTAVSTVELFRRHSEGKLTDGQLIAGALAFEKLGHARAVRDTIRYLREARAMRGASGLADPVPDAFDPRYAIARLSSLAPAAGGEGWQQLAAAAAAAAQRAVLNAGRHTVTKSATAARVRWRRITDSNPCAWCTYQAALTANYPDINEGFVRYFHPQCGCSVVEAYTDELSPTEDRQFDLYDRAYKACQAKGLSLTPKHIVAQMRELGDDTVGDRRLSEGERRKPGPKPQPGGADGGKKPPGKHTSLGGFDDDPSIHRLRHTEPLGALPDWVGRAEVLASHIGPADDPARYFSAEEAATAAWLQSRFGIVVRSVLERKGRSIKSPDGWAVDLDLSVEMKHPTTHSYLTLTDHLIKAAKQGDLIILRADPPISRDLAEKVLRRALSEAGQHIQGAIIEVEGGGVVVWTP